MYAYFVAVVLGVVEGLTEFLPVSSTGHLILVGHLLGYSGEASKSFEVFIQLGAILAVAWIYRGRFWEMAKLAGHPLRGGARLTPWHLALAMAPAILVGLLAHGAIKEYLFRPGTVVIGLVAGALFMLGAERWPRRVAAPGMDALTYAQAFLIGCFQCLALWPGFSRSGATIAGGLLVGAGLRAATDFSFVLAVPVMVAATSLDLLTSLRDLSRSDIGPFAVGFLVSFAVAWLAVVAFLRFLERVRLSPFAYYRFAVAGVVGAYFAAHGTL